MKRTDKKSYCPVNHCLEAVGDQWSLLIIRDITLFGKHTYKEFLASSERITTSVLADRLANLENLAIIRKEPHPRDGRQDYYSMTEKGIGLIPVILDMMEWGTRFDPESTGHRKKAMLDRIRRERGKSVLDLMEKVRQGGAAFM